VDVSDIDRPTTDTQVYGALDAATRAIAGLASVNEVLQVIVDQVRLLVGARYAALGIVDGGGVIERFITSGMDDATRESIGAPPRGRGILGLIIHEKRSLRIGDIASDERRHGFPPNHPPMHSFLGVPIVVKGRSVGNLYLTDRARGLPFTAEDQDLVETFARHAAIAIENARLHEQVQRLAIVDERERISKDLHDGIIQSIYAVGLSLEDVPDLMADDPDEVVHRVERAIDSLHLTIRDIRNFIFGLRPELLSGASIEAGLAAIAEESRHNSMVDIELQVAQPIGEPTIETTAHLLAIVNEALSNISRHSGASRALVALSTDAAGLHLTITDNGHGFDAAAAKGPGHQGLGNMRSRAADIRATIEIDSEPRGTTIRLDLPPETEER
jgi:two-component system, NarL family, sensor histidine kinase DevS